MRGFSDYALGAIADTPDVVQRLAIRRSPQTHKFATGKFDNAAGVVAATAS